VPLQHIKVSVLYATRITGHFFLSSSHRQYILTYRLYYFNTNWRREKTDALPARWCNYQYSTYAVTTSCRIFHDQIINHYLRTDHSPNLGSMQGLCGGSLKAKVFQKNTLRTNSGHVVCANLNAPTHGSMWFLAYEHKHMTTDGAVRCQIVLHVCTSRKCKLDDLVARSDQASLSAASWQGMLGGSKHACLPTASW
jgi:hypothetical protein